MWVSKHLVVFSMDLTITRSFGVMGELASLRGLKFKMTFKILFAMMGRERMRTEREFRVASTKTASLGEKISRGITKDKRATYLLFSWNTDSILSNRPDASASRFFGGMRA